MLIEILTVLKKTMTFFKIIIHYKIINFTLDH